MMYELWQVVNDDNGYTPFFLIDKNQDFNVIYGKFIHVIKEKNCAIIINLEK